MEETVVELILNATTAAKTSMKSSAAKIEGSVGSTDNRLVRSNGTGTFTVQATGITVDDSNRVGIGRAPTTHMVEITSQDNSADTGLQIFANNETQSMTFGWSQITTTFSKLQIKSTNAGLELLRTDNSVLFFATDGTLTLGNTAVSGSDARIIVAKNDGLGGVRSASMRFDSSFNFGYFDQDSTFIFGANYLAPENSFVINSAGAASFIGDIVCSTAGKGLQIKSGTGARAGTAVLVAGTVTVTNTTVTANTRIFLTVRTTGGTLGTLSYTLSAGASFTINSSSGSDTSTVTYLLIEVT